MKRTAKTRDAQGVEHTITIGHFDYDASLDLALELFEILGPAGGDGLAALDGLAGTSPGDAIARLVGALRKAGGPRLVRRICSVCKRTYVDHDGREITGDLSQKLVFDSAFGGGNLLESFEIAYKVLEIEFGPFLTAASAQFKAGWQSTLAKLSKIEAAVETVATAHGVQAGN